MFTVDALRIFVSNRDQALADGIFGQLGDVMNTEFSHHFAPVDFHCGVRDVKVQADLGGSHAVLEPRPFFWPISGRSLVWKICLDAIDPDEIKYGNDLNYAVLLQPSSQQR